MRSSILTILATIVSFGIVPAVIAHNACPLFTFPVVSDGNKCVCKDLLNKTHPFKTNCGANVVNNRGRKSCDEFCNTPSSVPKKKRSVFLLEDGTVAPCPRGTISCPIELPQPRIVTTRSRSTATRTKTVHVKIDPFKDQYECVDPKYDLDNCGGCALTGVGKSCLDTPGVRGTACIMGECQIFSCLAEYTMVSSVGDDDQVTKTCVRND